MDRPITSIPTYDKSPDRVFRLWQDAGRIPSHYGSWDELEADFLSRLKDGTSAKEARKAMGVEYRSIAGSNLLETNISSSGEPRGLNRRAIREDIDPLTERHIRTNYGEEKLQQFRSKLQNDWFKLSEGERRHVQGMTGAQQHRGHGNAASSGGSISINNMFPENGRRNSAHGPEPRFPQGVMDDTGMTKNYMEDFYEWDLEQQGLSRGTRPSNALAAAGDEQMVSFHGTDPRKYSRNPEAGRPPETFEMQTEKLKQLEQQGISRQAIDNYERNQSAALSIGDSTAQSGPVKVTPGTKQYVKVQPPSVEGRVGRAKPRLVGKGKAAIKGLTKAIPGPADDLAIGGLYSVGAGLATLATTGSPALALEETGTSAVDFATGDLDGGALADGTVTGQQRARDQRPTLYGAHGPDVDPVRSSNPGAAGMMSGSYESRRSLQTPQAAPQPRQPRQPSGIESIVDAVQGAADWMKQLFIGK